MSAGGRELKRRLKRTWATFFSRYGGLLPIQVKAIPAVLDGKDVMIVAPTAGGKTEAVVAPLTERLLQEGWEGLSIIYLCPTRALVNDTLYRLKEQLEELEISVAARTGDKPQFNEAKPPDFLITTPESFDSLLCRYVKAFENVKAVVIDEIHLLDNTYRGDQLRILLKRLRQLADFNTYALSATVANPEEVARRYLKDFVIVTCEGVREVEYTLLKSMKEVYEVARRERLKKLLVFCNARKNVELTAEEVEELWRGYVVAHHGSLSKSVRESAEAFMREANRGICVATMTLEVGIDIGDIDAVVLAEVPWSISSLLQRIGRGSRRTQKCRVLAIWHTEEERDILRSMLEVAKKGVVEYEPYEPDLSVVVQQVFSILYSLKTGLDFESLWKLFDDFCSEDELRAILVNLEKLGWIMKRAGKWYATEKLMNLAERGKIHSNIPDNVALKVVNTTTGEVIGEITLPVDPVFALGGRVWQVLKISDKVYVKPAKSEAQAAKFKQHRLRGAFYYLLPEELKR